MSHFIIYWVLSRIAIYRYAGVLDHEGSWDCIPLYVAGWMPVLGELVTGFILYSRRTIRR